jgi:DNA-binding NarL/FixJ family response regulator
MPTFSEYACSTPTEDSHQGRKPIRIVLGDQSKMECELLLGALHNHGGIFQVVHAGTYGQELVEIAARESPDIALISAKLAEGATSGLSALREMKTRQLKTARIMLLDKGSRELVVEAFRLGAHGIFYRDDSVEHLRKCIQVVLRGQIWASNDDFHYLVDALQTAVSVRPVDAAGEDLLTARQKELVSMVMEGLTNREIAQHMSIGEHTVKNYLFRIFDKLGVSSRAELIIYSMNNRMTS